MVRTEAGGAFVTLYVDSVAFNAGLKNALDATQKFCDQAQAAANGLIGSFSVWKGFISSSVSEFATFDDQMRVVRAATDAVESQFASLRAMALELGTTSTFTLAQIASAMASLGHGGFNVNEIQDSIASITDLARATGTELPIATDVASSALRAFDLRSSEMPKVCDVLTAAANGSTQTLEELGETFKCVAPIAAH